MGRRFNLGELCRQHSDVKAGDQVHFVYRHETTCATVTDDGRLHVAAAGAHEATTFTSPSAFARAVVVRTIAAQDNDAAVPKTAICGPAKVVHVRSKRTLATLWAECGDSDDAAPKKPAKKRALATREPGEAQSPVLSDCLAHDFHDGDASLQRLYEQLHTQREQVTPE